ncbi:MAG: hypothetical protein OFPII_29010 [Osedax symbiont Rs1]|nr:MAG: hypothetical protein OFPII_29010 [Osedax symbiont Rs1]
MKKSVFTLALLLSTSVQAVPTGLEIMHLVEDSDRSHDMTQIMLMKIRRGDVELKRLMKSETLRTAKGRKTFMQFEKPAEIRGTRFLIWSDDNPDVEDDMWISLPNSGLVRRISGSGKQGVFMRSDLLNEDIQPRAIEDDTHVYLRTEACGENECYVVESTPVRPDSSFYGKRLAWVRTDIFQADRIERYSKQGRLLKTSWYTGYKNYAGSWFASEMVTKNALKDSETRVSYRKIEVNRNLTAQAFSQQRLK